MKTVRVTFFLVATVLLMGAGKVFAVVTFNDGAYHKIDYVIDDWVSIDQGLPDAVTHVEVTSGGGIAPGKGYGYIVANGSSRVTVSGGELGWTIWSWGDSTTLLKSGYIRGGLSCRDDASVRLEGGSVQLALTASGHSNILMSGGSVGGPLELQNQAWATLSGGTIGTHIMSGAPDLPGDTCLVTCIGNGFKVNGHSVGYEDSARDFAVLGTLGGYSCLTGTITGTLLDGSPMNNTFYISRSSDIIFIPEPATLLLLGLGGIVMRLRRRCIS